MKQILEQINLNLPLPQDSKLSNLTLSGETITVETIAEYLLRVDENSRYLGMEVNIYSPAGDYNINLIKDSIQSGYITNSTYIFESGVEDSDFVRYIKSEVISIIVDTYDQLVSLPAPESFRKVLVLTDSQNNGGKTSEYNMYSNGAIMWQASISINDL